jgi:CRISPR-associated protein Cmr1
VRFTLHTNTPLWTGGVAKGEMERIHEAGLLGSLRWWYEVIVRGLGGDACDPTSDNRCPRHDNSLCDVCRLFGATGRSRRFRLRMQDGTRVFNSANIPLPSGHQPRNNRLGGWFFPAQAQTGSELKLTITPLSANSHTHLLAVPLALIDRHAALGAKVSNGQGVVRIKPNDADRINVSKALLDQLLSQLSAGTADSNGLPDLRDFFFAKLTFQEPTANPNWWHRIKGITWAREKQLHSINVHHPRDRTKNEQLCREARINLQALVAGGILPLAPAVRNGLRFGWFPSLFNSGRAPKPLEDYLFGRTGSLGNIGSKIEVSHAYRVAERQWEFRIWGWVPCELPQEIRLNRNRFLSDLKSTLKNPRTWNWVMDGPSPVCTLADDDWYALDCDDNDGRAYLEKLLSIAGGNAQ